MINEIYIIHNKSISENENEFNNRFSMKTKGPISNPSGEAKEIFERAENDDKTSIQKILQKLDDRVFVGAVSALNVFRKFDVDRDGYVSYEDIRKKNNELSLYNQEELDKLITYLDPEKKGFIGITEFSKKIRPNVLHLNETGKQITIPYTEPSHEWQNNLYKSAYGFNEFKESVVKEFKPSVTESILK